MAHSTKNRRVLPAQEPLWETHYRRFRRLVRCPETAADLLQELRLRVLEWTRRHGEPKREGAFVAQAARSVFADWCRAKRRSAWLSLLQGEESPEDEVPDPGPDPYERLESSIWLRTVRAELNEATNSPAQREILATWDEPTEVVAVTIGSTPTAVRTYRYKLVRRLRQNRRLRDLARAA